MTVTGLTMPQGSCMIHGAYHGPCCPACVTRADPYIITAQPVRLVPRSTTAGSHALVLTAAA